jgi:mono/diheme cytochrome c family protein
MRYAVVLLGALAMFGCRQDMHDQPRYRLNAASDFWSDRRAARPAVQGTVARGQLKADSLYYTGTIQGKEVDLFPMPVTREMVERGRDRYNVYCSPCHGLSGKGDGMIVSRGLKNPPSYHTEALRDSAAGHFFAVITKGNGSMASYAARIPVEDRWAIVSYIRVLQQSQNVLVTQLTAGERDKVEKEEGMVAAPAPGQEAHE